MRYDGTVSPILSLIESVTNPEVKKGMKEALSQLQSSLEKVQRQEKGLKKGFF